MTLRTYLRILRERWRLVVTSMLVTLALAVAITLGTQKIYESSAQIFVVSNSAPGTITGQYDQAVAAQTVAGTFASVVTAPDIINAVKTTLNSPLTTAALKSKISATAVPNKAIIEVHATDPSPVLAQRIASAAAAAFKAYIESTYTPAGKKIASYKLELTDPPVVASTPVSPNPTLNISLGLLLGILAGIALAVAREVLDTRVKDPEAFSAVAQAPVMGVVVEDPKTPKQPIASRIGEQNQRAENFRQLRANLQFANVDEHPRVIAVTSSVPGEGKTTVAMNLAFTMSEAGFTVCLVDADLRRPSIAPALGLLGPVGLTSVLINQIALADAIQQAGTNLYVLTSGPIPPNPSEVLGSSYVRDVIRSLLDRVDYVVLDTAPLLPVADGAEVAALADGTLLVARHKQTTDNLVKRAVTVLRGVDARLIGVVLNRVPQRRNADYGYGYTYYRADREPQPAPAPVKRAKRSADV